MNTVYDYGNKTVVVTGGARGIGKSIALAFSKAGASVVIADIDENEGHRTEAIILEKGGNCLFIQTNVSKEEECRHLFLNVAEKFEAIRVLVNNAAIARARSASIIDDSMENFDRVLSVNLRGVFMCAKFCAPLMSKGAAIINIASTRAHMSEAYTEGYAASKGGVRALTHALAVSLGSRGIRVNAISPGWIDILDDPSALNAEDHRQHPAGRVGMPDDIAQACLFLGPEQASGFITGSNLNVDGGMSIKMIYSD